MHARICPVALAECVCSPLWVVGRRTIAVLNARVQSVFAGLVRLFQMLPQAGPGPALEWQSFADWKTGYEQGRVR